MKIEPELLAKLKSLDDKQLSGAIEKIAEAVGADEKQKKRALGNVSYIKRRIASADEKEAGQLADKLIAGGDFDQAKIEELMRILKG